MNFRSSRVIGGAAIAALFLVYAGILAYQAIFSGTDRSMTAGVKVGTPFNLIDHNGNPITEAALENHPSALFFGLTHCPDVCPTTLYEMSVWLDDMGEEGSGIQAFFFSVDPERDTPELMKVYVENMSDRITGITGDPEEVERVARAWNIYWQKVAIGADDYTMDHTASVLLLDRNGTFRDTIPYLADRETALAKLRAVAQY
jgi:protein SCO1/2